MHKINSTTSTFLIATTVAAATLALGIRSEHNAVDSAYFSGVSASAARADDAKPAARWAASATGRVEPVSGQIRLISQVSGQVRDVLAKTNDKVMSGDLLVVLEDEDYIERIVAAAAEVDVREGERAEEESTGIAKDRQVASDAVASAARELFAAKRAFDEVYMSFRKDGGGAYAVTTARDTIDRVEKKLERLREELDGISANSEMPLLTRLESSLEIARSELSMAEAAFERTRIRAPFEGTVLNVHAHVGESATPSAANALVTFGDISSLQVRAEVEERDVGKVRIGQKVVVRTDAFPGREFKGEVTEIASALGSPRIATRGPRRPNDVDVLEVVAKISGTPPLLTGMRVDVFFEAPGAGVQKTAASSETATN